MNSSDDPKKREQEKQPENEVKTPFGIPIVLPSEGDGLTDEEREKINEALRSGEAQKRFTASAGVRLDAVDTDARQLYS